MSEMKKVTITFYTKKDCAERIKNKILSDYYSCDGLIKTKEENVNIKFTPNKNLIIANNRSYSEEEVEKIIFNVEKIDREKIKNKSDLMTEMKLYSRTQITEYMQYNIRNNYYYENDNLIRDYNSYDFSIYNINYDNDIKELEKRRITENTSFYYLCLLPINDNNKDFIATLKPVDSKFYLNFIEKYPVSMLTKFLYKKGGFNEKDYSNSNFVKEFFKCLKLSIKSLIEEKKYEPLMSILRILYSNKLSVFNEEFKDNEDLQLKYFENSNQYKINKDILDDLINLIRKNLNSRNLLEVTSKFIRHTANNHINKLLLINGDVNQLNATHYAIRNIIKDTEFLPENYDDFIFNTEHKTEFDKFKARIMRLNIDIFFQNNFYTENKVSDSWNKNYSIYYLNLLRSYLMIGLNEKVLQYSNSYSDNFIKYPEQLAFNSFTDEERKEIFDIIKEQIKLYCINKELPENMYQLGIRNMNMFINDDLVKIFKDIFLDTFENCSGKQKNTVKSLVRNGLYLTGDSASIFDKLDNKYVLLRQLKMTVKLGK